MKKFFAIAALAIAAMTASAQTWVGGELGFNYEKAKNADNGFTQFSIAPEIGYDLDETWSVACALSFEHFEGATTNNTFAINPYVRYNFAQVGAVKFFVDGGINFSTTHHNGVEKNENAFGLGFRPGMAYGFCEKAGLVCHIGDLSWSHKWQDEASSNIFNLGLTNAISFGVYFNL